jgi:hypothetical protein
MRELQIPTLTNLQNNNLGESRNNKFEMVEGFYFVIAVTGLSRCNS